MPTHRLHTTFPARPRVGEIYVLCVPYLTAIGAFGGTTLTFAGLSYTGFIWVMALLFGMVLLCVEKGLRPEHLSYFPAAPWLALLAWVGASFCWLDEISYQNVQDALQLGMPVLVATIASLFTGSRQGLEKLVRAYFHTVPLLAILAAVWVMGLATEEPGAALYITVRPLALTAVVMGGLFIAGSKQNFNRGWLGWLACLAMTVATGSRMASAAMLILPILNPVNRNLLRKSAAIAAIGIIGVGVYLTPLFQERFFHEQEGGVSQIAAGEFDSAGRFEAWPMVLEQALRRPWLGHGEGSVKYLVAEVWDGSVHPHNDYLRVGYELGIVGLALFVGVVGWQLASLGHWIRRTDGVVQQAFAGAWLGLAAFLVIAFTDNPIIYNLYYMNPVFALMGAAYKVARQEELDSTAQGLGPLITRSQMMRHSIP